MSHPAPPDRDDEEVELYDSGLGPAALRRRREIVLTVAALLLIAGVAMFSARGLLYSPTPSRAELRWMVLEAIRDALPNMSVGLGNVEELTFNAVGEHLFEVSGQLAAVDRAGKSQQYTFTCVVRQAENGRWRPERLLLTPLFERA
jgi:hypothetical protein